MIMQAKALDISIFSRLAGGLLGFSQRHWRFVVVAMLLLLHVAAVRGVTDGWARALLLAHLGLLLLWQPFVRGEHQVTAAQAVLIALAAVAMMLWLDWWVLAFWVVVLAGLVGGKIYSQYARWQRRYYFLVFVYLLALLAVLILPEIAPRREISKEVHDLAALWLPVLFLVMALLPTETDVPEAPQAIDFFYSIFLMLVLGMVVLGSFTIMTLGRTSYLDALAKTVYLIGGTVFVIGLAWNPRTGYAGLNVFVSRYLFSIGLPLEQWLYILAELSQMETRPDRFLADSVGALARLPWVAGVSWRTAQDSGETGAATPYVVEFENSELTLAVFSRYRTSPALHWHLHLLGQLLGEFYLAKLREQKLQQQGYLQAVHETGARMTHDVKNLLQSLNTLCSIAEREGQGAELQALIRRQLPAISQRLSATMEKLQRPQTEDEQLVEAGAWWEDLARHYQGQGVEFIADSPKSCARIPKSLFDGAADNLLNNALAKRSTDPGIRVRAALREAGEAVELRVSDSGRAVAPEIAGVLLRAPITSGGGLGIGLFQAARHAESLGYSLILENNQDGNVVFALRRAAA